MSCTTYQTANVLPVSGKAVPASPPAMEERARPSPPRCGVGAPGGSSPADNAECVGAAVSGCGGGGAREGGSKTGTGRTPNSGRAACGKGGGRGMGNDHMDGEAKGLP